MINRKILLSLIAYLFLVTWGGIAYAKTGEAPDAKSVAAGKKLYIKNCQSCHQKNGVGEAPIPQYLILPGYVTAMPLNDSSHAWHHGDEQLVNTILKGTPSTKRMPAWEGVLSEKQAWNIVAYIKSLWSARIIDCQGPRHMSCM